MKDENNIFNYVASKDEIKIEINKLKELLPILQKNQDKIYENIIKDKPFISTNYGDDKEKIIKQNLNIVNPIKDQITQYQLFFNNGETIDDYNNKTPIYNINDITQYLAKYKPTYKEDNKLKDIEIKIYDKNDTLELFTTENTHLLSEEGDIIKINNDDNNIDIVLGTIQNNNFVLNKDLNIPEIKEIINNINEISSTQKIPVPTINTDVIEENVKEFKTKFLPFFQNNQYDIYNNINNNGITDKIKVVNSIEKIKQYQAYFNKEPTDIETNMINELNNKNIKAQQKDINTYLTHYKELGNENFKELNNILDNSKLIITDMNQIKLKLSISNDDSKDIILKKLVNFKLEKEDRITINNNILLGTMQKTNMLSSSLKFVLNKDLSIQGLDMLKIEGLINRIIGQYNNEIKDKIHTLQPINSASQPEPVQIEPNAPFEPSAPIK